MCFSAGASFGLGAGLLAAGAYCVPVSARRDQAWLPLALTPVLFGVQQIAEGLLAQGRVWHQIQQGEQHLIALQAALQQNLAALAATGSFDRTMQALLAAIHLLTSKTGHNTEAPPAVLPLRANQPGQAA
jgi:conjugal transfer/entry exclusion protein